MSKFITTQYSPIFGSAILNICKGDSGSSNDSARNNRANQMNPNHKASGPGRFAGYKGDGTQADRDNHANQLNPNNSRYKF